MVKRRELRSSTSQRFIRGSSVEASNKYHEPEPTREDSTELYTKQNVENEKKTDEDAITDGEWSSDSSIDEGDFEERRAKNNEKDEEKLNAEDNFKENNYYVNRSNDPIDLNIISSNLTNVLIVLRKYFFIIVIALIAILFSIFLLYNTANANNVKNNEKISYEMRVENFLNTIKQIKNDFPSQKNVLWKSLFQKIKYVNESQPTRPAVMILIYNNSKEVAECIALKIGRAASNFLNTPGVVELIGDSDMNETDNELVIQYREPLKKKGVMIVYRLDEIPGLVAQSFHTFCDTYNPLVKRAVLLFTLDNSRLRNAENINPTKKAMEVLKLLWRDTLVDSKLNSLITRLTDTVLEINSEKNIKC